MCIQRDNIEEPVLIRNWWKWFSEDVWVSIVIKCY